MRILLASCTRLPRGDGDDTALHEALAALGHQVEWHPWDAPDLDPAAYDLVLPRATWDYADRHQEFLTWCASAPALRNPVEVVRWNTDKSYLLDLREAGVPTVPTELSHPGDSLMWPVVPVPALSSRDMSSPQPVSPSLSAASPPSAPPSQPIPYSLAAPSALAAPSPLAAPSLPAAPSSSLVPSPPSAQSPPQPTPEIVIKPAIGAGSRGAARFPAEARPEAESHLAALHATGRAALIQPYQPSVSTEGETALVYFGGIYSHAFRKGPMLHPATPDPVAVHPPAICTAEKLQPTRPTPDQHATADQALTAAAALLGLHRHELLYARVDLLRAPDGTPVLLELELTEPGFGFRQAGPEAPYRLASAISAARKG